MPECVYQSIIRHDVSATSCLYGELCKPCLRGLFVVGVRGTVVAVEVFKVFVEGVLHVRDVALCLLKPGTLLGLPFTLLDDPRLETVVAVVGQFSTKQKVEASLTADKSGKLAGDLGYSDQERGDGGGGGGQEGKRFHRYPYRGGSTGTVEVGARRVDVLQRWSACVGRSPIDDDR